MITRICICACVAIMTVACAVDLVSIVSTFYLITDASHYRCISGKPAANPRYPWDKFDCIRPSHNASNKNSTSPIMPEPYAIAAIISGRILVAALGCATGTLSMFAMTEMSLTTCNYYTALTVILFCCVSPLLTLSVLAPAIFGWCACKELNTPLEISFPDVQISTGGPLHYYSEPPPSYGEPSTPVRQDAR